MNDETIRAAAEASSGVAVAIAMLSAKGRGDDAELMRLANDATDAQIRYASVYLAQAVYEAMVECGISRRQAGRKLARLTHDAGLQADAVETALMVVANGPGDAA